MHLPTAIDPAGLEPLGWNEAFAASFREHAEAGLRPARVAVAHNYLFEVLGADGGRLAEIAGRLKHRTTAGGMPVVGDWVAIRLSGDEGKATIEAVLPRRSVFARKAAGETTRRQLVAANIDTVFLVCGLDEDFNLRRIERYLVAIRDSGAAPVIVLNKADRAPDPDAARRATAALAPGVPVHVMSCLDEKGAADLRAHLAPGRTVALLGSSGVGKSTIINRLLGVDRQRTGGVRPRDGRGRHTTTQRELIVLPGGGLLIDNPGMRELQLWDGAAALDDAFEDIDALARGCRFRDCRHDQEPGCAVHAAVEAGQLTAERLDSYHTLQREDALLQERRDELARLEAQGRVKSAPRTMRAFRSGRQGGEGSR